MTCNVYMCIYNCLENICKIGKKREIKNQIQEANPGQKEKCLKGPKSQNMRTYWWHKITKYENILSGQKRKEEECLSNQYCETLTNAQASINKKGRDGTHVQKERVFRLSSRTSGLNEAFKFPDFRLSVQIISDAERVDF